MNAVQKIARNTALLSAGEVTTAFLGFIFLLYVARYLNANGFGALSLAMAMAAILGIFVDFGLKTLTIRDIARDKSLSARYLGNIAAIKIVLSAVVFGLMVLIVHLAGYQRETTYVVCIIFLSAVLSSFSMMFYSIFQAYEKMEYIALAQVINSGTLLAGAFWAVGHKYNIVILSLVFVLSGSVTLVYCTLVSFTRFARPKFEFNLEFWGQILRQAWPIGLALALSATYNWVGTVLLSIFKGKQLCCDIQEVSGFHQRK
jgi:O-antigen/teichoic acid export membrane protein